MHDHDNATISLQGQRQRLATRLADARHEALRLSARMASEDDPVGNDVAGFLEDVARSLLRWRQEALGLDAPRLPAWASDVGDHLVHWGPGITDLARSLGEPGNPWHDAALRIARALDRAELALRVVWLLAQAEAAGAARVDLPDDWMVD